MSAEGVEIIGGVEGVVGLGSSLGGSRRALRLAVAALGAHPDATVLRTSRVYLSQPVGGVARRPFLNAALRLRWAGSVQSLLRCCKELEARLGRRPAPRWADRALDLDLLWFEGVALTSEALTLPHPQLGQRPFAWRPLLDVWPGAIAPEGACACPQGLAAVGVLRRPRSLSAGRPG